MIMIFFKSKEECIINELADRWRPSTLSTSCIDLLLRSLKAASLLLIQFSWCVRELVADCPDGISLHMVAVWKISPHRNNTCSICFLFDKPQCKEVAFFCCCFGVGIFCVHAHWWIRCLLSVCICSMQIQLCCHTSKRLFVCHPDVLS